jgi:methyl-accepting chemotaxis protein
LLERIGKRAADYTDAAETMLEKSRNNDMAKAVFYKNMEPIIQEAEKDVSELLDVNVKGSDASYDSSRERYSTILWSTWSLIAFIWQSSPERLPILLCKSPVQSTRLRVR